MKRFVVLIIASLGLLIMQSCGGGQQEPKEPAFQTEPRSGRLTVATGSTLAPIDLEVVTLAASGELDPDGAFEVSATTSDRFQMQFFQSKATGNSIYVGLYDPLTNDVMADVNSTALSLLLTSPALLYAPQDRLAEYLRAAQSSAAFQRLIANLHEAYARDAETALDPEVNPEVFQTLIEAMVETMEHLAANEGNVAESGLGDIGDVISAPPYIEQGEDQRITFVNPRHVYYGVGIYPIAGDSQVKAAQDVFVLDRIEKVMSFDWSWDWPFVDLESAFKRKPYDLPDGHYRIDLKKFDLGKFGDFSDPAGSATTWNLAQAVINVIGIFGGELPITNANLVKDLPRHLHLNVDELTRLSIAVSNRDAIAFLKDFAKLVADNSDELAYWIWQDTANSDSAKFIKQASRLVEKVNVILKVYGIMNDDAPFFFDLVAAPSKSYDWTMGDGKSTAEENNAPQPRFSIDPPSGIVGTMFDFDASATTDDGPAPVVFRWDFEGDRVWDTGWNTNPDTQHAYDESAAHTAILEVRDGAGLRATTAHKVNVGGGAGTASHVKLFRDNLPWDSDAIVTVLEGLGFLEGIGPNTYEILNSNVMGTVPLIPGEDLIIISNDQNQDFYDYYSRSEVRFANFVSNGGAMFWEASDEGWANGSMAAADVDLPGNVKTAFAYDKWNYVTDANLPLVKGLPTAMDHNYASHESFADLPDGTTVYMVNESDDPTLIEFNWGRGWIIMTGQPLEHQYENVYGQFDLEQLLPRIVAYFTSVPIPDGSSWSLEAVPTVGSTPSHMDR